MKPTCPVARRGDYVVMQIAHADAVRLVEAHHYAHSASNTSVHAHGMFRVADGALVGAALWMPPPVGAATSLARAHLGHRDRHREVLSLSRLVVAPGEPQNATSMLLARSEAIVRHDTRWGLLVTYADRDEGHDGAIYRATNWSPDGECKPQVKWRAANGRLVAQKATRNRSVRDMESAGYVRGKSRKVRFVKVVRKAAGVLAQAGGAA